MQSEITGSSQVLTLNYCVLLPAKGKGESDPDTTMQAALVLPAPLYPFHLLDSHNFVSPDAERRKVSSIALLSCASSHWIANPFQTTKLDSHTKMQTPSAPIQLSELPKKQCEARSVLEQKHLVKGVLINSIHLGS